MYRDAVLKLVLVFKDWYFDLATNNLSEGRIPMRLTKHTGIFCLSLLFCLAPLVSQAQVKVGENLSRIEIKDKGRVIYDEKNDEFSYKPFDSETELKGKVRSLFLIAGVTGASDINNPFIDALSEAGFPADTYQTVSIIDTDQSIFGTGWIVNNNVKEKQKKYPNSMYAIDAEGTATKTYKLQPVDLDAGIGFAVIVIDRNAKIIRFKDGKLTKSEVEDFIKAVRAEIGK